jgi:hypothetical protein
MILGGKFLKFCKLFFKKFLSFNKIFTEILGRFLITT